MPERIVPARDGSGGGIDEDELVAADVAVPGDKPAAPPDTAVAVEAPAANPAPADTAAPAATKAERTIA